MTFPFTLRSAAALGLVAALGAACAGPRSAPARGLEPGATLLFQGDSITDAGRDRGAEGRPNDAAGLGRGYVARAAEALLADEGLRGLRIHNRGISGHKVLQLADRWDADALALEPDVLSVLIGVNDIWHGRDGRYDGTVETYERDYRALLARTREALPRVTLVVCEPFVLHCGAVSDDWFPEFDAYRAAARRVADEAGALFVPFHSAFEEALAEAPPEHWAPDGVHPSAAGAQRMAEVWLEVVHGEGAGDDA
ncbi:MAG: SGNH/GDSL hydrolase family protein [Planctomycetota bacterium]